MTTKGSLEKYRSRRSSGRSPEPVGGISTSGGEEPLFVVQEHGASTHHFDFRIECDGVLRSWAVPKGLSTDPRVRRLAVPTEDHPLEYADFEGVIPEDEYGGGSVIVWDRGNYVNLAEKDGAPVPVSDGLKRGHLSVWLKGKKLKGGYALVRKEDKPDSVWFVVKMKDGEADARRNPVSTQPESVITSRTIKDVEREAQEAQGSNPEGGTQ